MTAAQSKASNQPKPKDDGQAFRSALGRFATGVTVITACAPSGELVGVTANSFNSVSLDPPMILWSLAKSSKGIDYFLAAEHFCVNVLAADQVSVSNHFASKQKNKFAELDYETGLAGAPLLPDCAARFECKTAFTYEGGDHLIFVGEVVAFDETNKPGLVFHQGRYAVSDVHAFHALDAKPAPTSGGFVDDYLDYLLSTAANRLQIRFESALEKHGLKRYEWRALAVLSDSPVSSLATISERTLVAQERLAEVLRRLESLGFVSSQTWDYDEEFFLTDAGQSVTLGLLAAAKSNEVDALSKCSADEVYSLKIILKKLIDSFA